MIRLSIILVCLSAIMASCIKDNPRRETYLADGSWKIEKVNITHFDSTGTQTNSTSISDVGFILLMHNGELLYEGDFSFSIKSQEFIDSSEMYFLFTDPLKPANTWQVGNYSKAFDLSFVGYIQDYFTFYPIATFTIVELSKKKFGLMYIKTDPNTGLIQRTEEWKMVRATH